MMPLSRFAMNALLAPALPSTAAVGVTFPKIAEKVVAYVLEAFAEEITLEDLAREAGMSRFNFCRRFHKECGVPPMRWLWNFRTILAAEFITLDATWSLTDIAFSCGFTSSAHFSRSFKTMFSKSPSQHKKEVLQATAAVSQSANFDGLFSNNRHAVLKAVSAAMTAP